MADVRKANPFYDEIENLLSSKAKIHNFNYKTTNAPTFDKIPSNYGKQELFKWGDHKNIRSFLRITTTKHNYANGKWKGELTWFWTFTNRRTNKAFITFNRAETTNNKGLKLTGVFSFIQRPNSNSYWEVKYQKKVEASDNKYINKANFNKYFPKPYWWTYGGKFDERYYDHWKLLESADELDNTCAFTGNGCTGKQEGATIKWTGEYEWTGGSGYESWCDNWYHKKWCDKVYMWSSNYEHKDGLQWYDHMYGGGSKHDLKSWVGSYYRGSWKKLSG